MSTTSKNPEQEREQKFLRRYIEYCRAMCSPRLQPKSATLLEDQYVRYRQEMRERAKKGKPRPHPPTASSAYRVVRVPHPRTASAHRARVCAVGRCPPRRRSTRRGTVIV